MSELKPYLVDVPVKVSIWIREECQRKQFEILNGLLSFGYLRYCRHKGIHF